MDTEDLFTYIVRAATNVHNELGPGLLESAYQNCMLIELKKMGIKARSEVKMPVFYCEKKVQKNGLCLNSN